MSDILTLAAAIEKLAASNLTLAAAQTGGAVKTTTGTTATKPAAKVEEVAEELPPVDEVEETPPVDEVEETPPVDEVAAAASYDLDALRGIGKGLLKAGKAKEMRAVISDLGAESISTLDEGQYDEAGAALTALLD